MVRFETSLGEFTLELDADKAPLSVANFLDYVDEGFFDGTDFSSRHPGFHDPGWRLRARHDTEEEQVRRSRMRRTTGCKNERGTIAMARTNVVDRATSQFFINLSDNDFLDHSGPANFGYAVFGHVVEGLDTIELIARERTGRKAGHDDVPVNDVVIHSVKRVEDGK